MEPFSIPAPLRNLTDPYPDPHFVLNAACRGGEQAREALVRLWLSEGIPYAFRKCPAIYESIRSWLSVFLDVHAKEIGIVGSARVGASLAPKKLGKKFSVAFSDLDVFIVSKGLFEKLKDEFRHWSRAFEQGEVIPNGPIERKFWKANNKQLPRNIEKGFLDPRFIPNRNPYPITRRMNESMFLLTGKLKRTPAAPHLKKASVRCYESWDSFVRQNSLNLRVKGRPNENSASM